MDNHPFSSTAKPQDTATSRRRSTRINYVTTVLLSGKDAGGASFREFTQTAVVNLHGCKLRTSYRIMVGILVTLECPKAGTSGKGVCVRVWDPQPGIAGHEIAVQLIKPQNLWGVPNPPPDWETVAKAMVQGRSGQAEQPARPAVPVAPPAPAPPPAPAAAPRPPMFTSPVASVAPPVIPPPAPPTAPPLAPPVAAPVAPPVPVVVAPPVALPVPPPAPPAPAARPVPVANPTVDQRLAELERRSTQLVESVLDIMRGQAEQLTRSCLEEFRQQVEALIQDSEVRLREGLKQSYEESAHSLIGLRTDLMEQMSSRIGQMVRSSEDTLRTRLRTHSAGEDKTAPAKPPAPVPAK